MSPPPDRFALPSAAEALPGRDEKMPVASAHYVTRAPMEPPFEGMPSIVFGMGCFWGPERSFWQHPGVFSTSVGYAGGHTPNPTYDEVCSGRSGHTEAIVTDEVQAAEEFIARVDSSSVMVNASTRFSDGGQYGLGAEIGISTDKLHARGPMGAQDLTTYKWIVTGQGHVRQ